MAGSEVGMTFSLVHLPAGRSQHTRQHGECMHDSLSLTGRFNHSLQEQEPQNDTWHKIAVVNFLNNSDPHPDQLALPTLMSIPHAFPTLNSCFSSTRYIVWCQYVHQVSKLGLCITFDTSKGQAYMTTTQSNEKGADVSTQHTL